MSRAYYNEIDPYAAAWLRNLISKGHIAPGDVDERSIVEVQPDDLKHYTQCHFFAGIGVWSHALRSAGWDDSRPVWTGSCPCQPFSAAGKRQGTADERHLWPHLYRLISACRPVVCFGEQVASKDGLAWLDSVQADLEAAGYASGAVDTCAAGVGAPHIRQRLYWVAYANTDGLQGRLPRRPDPQREAVNGSLGCGGAVDGLADSQMQRCFQREVRDQDGKKCTTESDGENRMWFSCASSTGNDGGLADADEDGRAVLGETRLHDHGQGRHDPAGCGEDVGLADACGERVRAQGHRGDVGSQGEDQGAGDQRQRLRPDSGDDGADDRPSPTHGFWRAADWLWCRDHKWRAVEPGTFPLAHGATSRVGRLRAYGNAIVAPQAEAFVTAAAQVLGIDLSKRQA